MERPDTSRRKNEKACAFTGHRSLERDFCAEELNEVIDELLREGVRTFYNGVAVGFDLLAAELVLAHAEEYHDLKLIACIPCEGQDKYFPAEDKIRYRNVLAFAEKIVLAERYFNGCMQARDRYMADRADILVTYCRKQTGGTAYTMEYFKRKKPNGVIIPL